MMNVLSGRRRRQRLTAMEAQLPAALDLFANSLRAGLTFLQAMAYVAEETPAPLSEEFKHVLREHQLGLALEGSLKGMAERVPSEDVELLVTAILIARQSGGNLAIIFQRLAMTIRERQQLRHQMAVLTTQGKMSGWVLGSMPIVLLVLMGSLDPSYLTPLLGTMWGWGILGAAVVMELLGAFFINRIVTLEA